MADFITIIELQDNSLLNDNIDSKRIYPAIRRIQEGQIFSILGKELYNKLNNDFGSLTGIYVDILARVKKYMYVSVELKLTYYLNNQITNKAVGHNSDQYLTSNNEDENKGMRGELNRDLTTYKNALISFLNDNSSDIPEWKCTNKSEVNSYSNTYSFVKRRR
jgi:hypothetical protein